MARMQNTFLPNDPGFIKFLFFYHVCFSFLFTWYIHQNGGDAIRYWELTAETGHSPENWLDHFGTRSYFIQFLNYFPSKILGLPFWIGNLLYSILSFIGIYLLFYMIRQHLPSKPHSPWYSWLLYFVFLLPNLHFWTSSVGKESLSFLGLVLFLWGSLDVKRRGTVLILGLLLSFLVRPLQGGILIALCIPVVWLDKELSKWFKLTSTVSLLLAAVLIVRFLLYITHMDGISTSEIQGFSDYQFKFLDQFAAGSAVPMPSYSWPLKFWTLFFRPLFGDLSSFWTIMASIENGISLLLFLSSIILLKNKWWKSLPMWIIYGMVFGLILMFVYAITLSNLGIMMRMKSFFIIFFHLSAIIALWKFET